jgi:hypothetical protein
MDGVLSGEFTIDDLPGRKAMFWTVQPFFVTTRVKLPELSSRYAM